MSGWVLGGLMPVGKRKLASRKGRATRKLAKPATDLRQENAALKRELEQAIKQQSASARDLQESLEYQTATSDVLKVISRSSFDLQPILDTLVATAVRLCHADLASINFRDGDVYRVVASFDYSPELNAYARNFAMPADRGTVTGRVALERQVVHVADVAADPEYVGSGWITFGKVHTGLGVPLLRDGEPIGVIALFRRRVEPFTERQIELVRTFADQAVIAMENARLLGELHQRTRDLEESLKYQTATSDVLKVISRSTFDLQRVLDTLIQTAAALCETDTAALAIRQGDVYRYVATARCSPEYDQVLRSRSFVAGRDSAVPRALLERKVVHIADASADPDYRFADVVNIGNVRTILGVPMFREDEVVGVIALARDHVEPFTERQIEVVRTFADQAVIAIENARLLSELRESLERQTATSEVLQVINASPGELTPVFEAMLDKALALCDALNGIFWSFHGDQMRVEATRGHVTTATDFFAIGRIYPIGTTNAQARLLRGERFVHILDVSEEYAYRAGDEIRRVTVEIIGCRTLLAVPLRKEGTYIGAIVIDRTEVKPFTDRQIALLESFAAQAVIAIENARLLGELRQSLEYQTATSDVLKVISRSTFDLRPILDTLVETAGRLCNSDGGGIAIRDGEVFRYVAFQGETEEFGNFLRQRTFAPGRDTGTARVLLEGKVIHIPDVTADPEYVMKEVVTLGDWRTYLGVPLLRDGTVVGVITVNRRLPEPFTDRQIELVRTFADQAVIAMENARLINETREALERQTATAEVLQVINSSPGDLSPVFEAMLSKALRLCDASFGTMQRKEGDHFHMLARLNVPPPFADFVMQPMRALAGGSLHRLLRGEAFVQINDVREGDLSTAGRRALAELAQARTVLWIPLRKDSAVLGVFVIYRTEVRPFTDKQIALLQNFAAQAVIAMENARLLGELRQSLEYQTATSDVLKVISRSAFDLQPVLDTLVETAMRLCHADLASINIREGEVYRSVARIGLDRDADDWGRNLVFTPSRATVTGRAALDRKIVHIADVAAEPEYALPEQVTISKTHTALGAPLLREGQSIGVLFFGRHRIEPFTERQIELIRTFADQAVIAMENARLFEELRDRQADLARSVEELTATGDVLKIISRSSVDLTTVLDTLVETVTRLCRADQAAMYRLGDHGYYMVAAHGLSEDAKEFQRTHPTPTDRGSMSGRVMLERRAVHIPDVLQDPEYTYREGAKVTGYRTLLGVPLLRGETLIGTIVVARSHVEPFSDKEIELVRTFADQAVIAIENARLFEELRESLEQQTATAEVLQVINTSPGDLKPVFDAVLGKALELCDAAYGILWSYEGGKMYPTALRGVSPAYADFLTRQGAQPVGSDNAHGRLLRGESVVHIADAAVDQAYLSGDALRRATVELGGSRTLLSVPLRKDNDFLGTFVIYRTEIRPFTDKQITLLQNFAAQAVIAMENARLLTETREALERQTATAEVLQIINTSPGELKPVFNAILDKALRLSHSAFGTMRLFDGTRFQLAAQKNVPQAYLDFTGERVTTLMGVHALGPAVARVLTEKCVVQIVDAKEDNLYQKGDPMRRAVVDLAGARTILFVPLLSDDVARGVIMVFRTEVRAFSDKEIALLQNFAAQAVIAMDNARLLGELRERQAELRVTFDNMGDGVALFDSTPRLVAWNRNFQTILDLPDALLAQHLTYHEYIRTLAGRGEFGNLDNIEEELERRVRDLDRPALFARTRPDGKVIEARRNPVPGGGFVLIYSDITERKRAEAEISAARDAAEKALHELQTAQASLLHSQKMAALGQLTAGIAHEIKNPLNFVNNFADLSVELLDELKEATADRGAEIDETIEMISGNLTKIAEHGRRADNIVKSMLAHSRGGSGDWQSVDLNALVEEALNLAYHGARAQDQSFNITMDRDLDRNLARIEVVPQDLTRVFLNLFGNGFYAANKRSGAGDGAFRPVLKVTTRDLGAFVEIGVRDNGTGIPPEHQEKLFQPFFTTKPTGEGTGLGLSISYEIITQRHGGTITVDSEVGEFTEFTVRLPRRQHPMAGRVV